MDSAGRQNVCSKKNEIDLRLDCEQTFFMNFKKSSLIFGGFFSAYRRSTGRRFVSFPTTPPCWYGILVSGWTAMTTLGSSKTTSFMVYL